MSKVDFGLRLVNCGSRDRFVSCVTQSALWELTGTAASPTARVATAASATRRAESAAVLLDGSAPTAAYVSAAHACCCVFTCYYRNGAPRPHYCDAL